ncbi:MAG: T9SS type A sorting domain-containing protein [Bacteroidetes bacterium]|nr:T9SS type A sorting domain-containing protein [Bacteroidota bacterium]
MTNRDSYCLRLLALIFFGILHSGLCAQPGWNVITPLPTTHSLNAVSFISESTGWIAGSGDLILKTNDGGTTWTKQFTKSAGDWWGIHFADDLHGWIAGAYGDIYSTSDGGSTWTKQASASAYYFYAMQFPDATNGFVLPEQDSLFYTSNAGTTWSRIKIDDTQYHYGMKFVSANEGWICGSSGQILHTVNGGLNWTAQNSGTTVDLYSIDFTDSNNGWAAGYTNSSNGTILHTSDGGTTWHSIVENFSDKITKIVFTSNLNGCAISNSGTIYHTVNGGAAWTTTYSSPHEGLLDLQVFAGGKGFVCGSSGAILKTTDSGTSWNSLYSTASHGYIIRDISFPDQENGWVLDDAASLVHTADSGKTWNDQTPYTSNFSSSAIYFSDSKRGWVVGNWPAGGYGQILRTIDGGNTFTFQLNLGVFPFVSVSFSDSIHGIAGTNNRMIYYTSNGGAVWDSTTVPTSANYMQAKIVKLVNNSTGYAILSHTPSTDLAKSVNGGASWSVIKSDNTQFTAAYTALSFVDAQNGYIAGFNSTGTPNKIYLLRTTDGGVTWSQLDFPSNLPGNIGNSQINAMYFSDMQHGWVAGGGYVSFILYTSDGGTSWTVQEMGTTVSWYTMKFSDSHVGYAAGWEGDIIKTTTGGLLGIFNQPAALERGINVYPNPASETITVVNPFPDKKMTHLTLSDMAGNTVFSYSISVNQFNLNTARIPDGIYLLQLRTENKIARQKVIIRH